MTCDGERLRSGEKLVGLCRKAWRVVRRLFPHEFPKDVPNPWVGVTMKTRVKKKKPAVTRDEVYAFAHGCIPARACKTVATLLPQWCNTTSPNWWQRYLNR